MPTYFLKTQFLFFVLTSFLLLNSGCKKSTTEPVETLALIVEDISCTEVWVKITTTNFQTPNTLTLFVNDKAGQNISLVSADTILFVDSLLPSQSYKIKAAFATNNQQLTTNEVIAKTMDTTSHNFSWQTFTFGEHSSSTLYDVAIIDENNIWAVGEIYMEDSLGNPDPTFYNVAHWDGLKWELKKNFYKGGIWSIKTIHAFNGNDIWFSGYMRYYNGQFIELPIPDILMGWTINKMWGTSSSDLYAVGNNGNIAHYDGKSWKKIESGTTADIQEIWGISEENNLFTKYLAANEVMLSLDNTNKLTKINATSDMIILSIWANSKKTIYTAGNGVVLYKNKLWEKVNSPTVNTIYRIRGQGVNDILGIGAPGSIVHYFNGYNWSYLETLPGNRFWRLDTKGSIAVFVGYNGEKAMLTLHY